MIHTVLFLATFYGSTAWLVFSRVQNNVSHGMKHAATQVTGSKIKTTNNPGEFQT